MKNIFLLFIFLFLFSEITYSQSFHDVIITEINYNSDSTMNSGNWIEIYNPTSNSINLVDWYVKNNNNDFYTIGSGVSIASHTYLVLAENLFEFSAIYPSVTNTNGPMNFGFSNSNDNIRLYSSTNTLITNVAYADSGQWGKGADGNGRTLELIDYNGNQNDPLNWFDGCMFGSPGVAYTPCNPEIVFSEINYKSASTMDAGDWVELHNVSSAPISLNQWSFKDENDSDIFYLPNITLQPDAYRVLCADIGKFVSRHPSIGGVNGPFNFGLSHKGEALRLFDSNGKLSYSTVYDNKAPWPTSPDSGGYTLELNNIHGHIDDGSNWFAGCLEGSPGEAYDPNCGTGMYEIGEEVFSIYPNPVSEMLFVNSYSLLVNTISVSDVLGKTVLLITDNDKPITEINVRNLSSGIYFIKIADGEKSFTEKFVKE